MDQEIRPARKKLESGFDTTAELWDRIADDLMNNSTPCYETVEELVVQACNLSEGEDPESDN